MQKIIPFKVINGILSEQKALFGTLYAIAAAGKAVGNLWDIRILIKGQIAGKIAALLERSMDA